MRTGIKLKEAGKKLQESIRAGTIHREED